MIRVLVVDDHPLVRDGLTAVLQVEPDMQVSGAVGTGEAALALLERTRPDVVVVDNSLPGMSGVDLCAALIRRVTNPRVVVLSEAPSASLMRRSVAAGALGFVAKGSATTTLRDAVRHAFRGEPFFDPSLARFVVELAGRGTRRQGPHGLTPAELDVVALLPKGLMNREIAVALGIKENTVKTHLRHALRKLAVRDRAQAAAIVVKEGLG
ncbi:MAG TPA: response regulator transcription factor [Mycobacteriales bacterium]